MIVLWIGGALAAIIGFLLATRWQRVAGDRSIEVKKWRR